MTTSRIPSQSSERKPQTGAIDLFAENQAQSDSNGQFENFPSNWLGLEIDHRRLFEAAQDGWFHPKSPGFVLGHECFVAEPNRLQKPHLIPIRIVFDAKKFPRFVNFEAHPPSIENNRSTNENNPTVVAWPAPIPLYAVSKMEVGSPDEKTQIRAMATQFSNVSLPSADFEIGNAPVCSSPVTSPDIANACPVKLPEYLDATQGSMAMAIWGVPHIQPWMDALQHALGLDTEGATAIVRELDAQWLMFPWLDKQQYLVENENSQLWKSAISTMRSPSATGRSPTQIAELIAQDADPNNPRTNTEKWLSRTLRIIGAEEAIDLNANGAGLAIQLALLRPKPKDFRTWKSELSCVSPATLWAAAMLCGWRNGYRALDKIFRGGATIREFLSTRALAASWEGDQSKLLPAVHLEELKQHREATCFTLGWGNRPILRKKWNSRAKWHAADLTNPIVENAARDVARQLGWHCVKRRLTLKECLVPISGQGSLSIDESASQIVVSQAVDLELPAEAMLIEVFNGDEFKRELAIKPGLLADPPGWDQAHVEEIPGLIYEPHFVTADEEQDLVACIDEEEWSTVLKRRVQQYGWRYDYKQRQLDSSMYLGPLPDWSKKLVQRLVDRGYMRERPDQLIVNEYCGDQGITAHTDHVANFAEQVVTISLLETWNMVFRPRLGKKRIEKPLEHGSVAVFTGDVRYKWTHEIPKRKFERTVIDGKRIARTRRVSLTFRKTQIGEAELLV